MKPHELDVDDFAAFTLEQVYASAQTTTDGRRKRLRVHVDVYPPQVIFRVTANNEDVYSGDSLEDAVAAYNELG